MRARDARYKRVPECRRSEIMIAPLSVHGQSIANPTELNASRRGRHLAILGILVWVPLQRHLTVRFLDFW